MQLHACKQTLHSCKQPYSAIWVTFRYMYPRHNRAHTGHIRTVQCNNLSHRRSIQTSVNSLKVCWSYKFIFKGTALTAPWNNVKLRGVYPANCTNKRRDGFILKKCLRLDAWQQIPLKIVHINNASANQRAEVQCGFSVENRVRVAVKW